MLARPLVPAVLLILTGCATRQTAPGVYRLIATGPARVLVPPGVSDPALAIRTFDFPLHKTAPSICRTSKDGVRVEPRHGFLRVTVERAPLIQHPAPWLADWTASLERQGCLSAGESATLAEQIVESVPLDPADAYRLLHAGGAIAGYLDLAAGYRLKLISPILREGAAPGASALETGEVSGTDSSKLTLAVKASADFLGYEISWYAIEPKASVPGSRVVFASAESHIGDQVAPSQRPRTNHFVFPDSAAYYRLFYLTRVSQADHNVAILSASSRAELDLETPGFGSDPDACAKAPPQTCAALPREVAVTTYLRVIANGVSLDVPVDSTVADTLRAAGIPQPAAVLPTLAVRRTYRGALVPVEFDRTRPDILTLKVTGHEDLRW